MSAVLRNGPRPTTSQGWLARLRGWVDDAIDTALTEVKDAAFANLPFQLVEIGAGRGSNLRRCEPGTRVIALEPNPAMHQRFRRCSGAEWCPGRHPCLERHGD